MNAIKILAETDDAVTVSKKDWLALLTELEDAQDCAAVVERRAQEKAVGQKPVRQNYLNAAEARRLLEGENAVKVWREKRGLSQRALAAMAKVSPSYLAEIESGSKPGSVDAIRKLAAALEIRMEDLATEPVLLKWFDHPAGISPGGRGAPPKIERFETLQQALEAARRNWEMLKHHGPVIINEQGFPIVGQDELFQEIDPETFDILRDQARR